MPKIKFTSKNGWESVCDACGRSNDYEATGKDAARLQWILDHVTNLECTENVAGNLEKFIIPATREDIDREMRGASPMIGQCTCYFGMRGCLDCPIHGQLLGKSSANSFINRPVALDDEKRPVT